MASLSVPDDLFNSPPSPKRLRLDEDSQESAHQSSVESETLDKNPVEKSETDETKDEMEAIDFDDEDDDDDDEDDDESYKFLPAISNISLFTEYIGQVDRPMEAFVNTMCWIEEQKMDSVDPKTVFSKLTGNTIPVPKSIPDSLLWKIIYTIATELPTRKRLNHITTLDDAINLVKTRNKIIVLTGAGVSVSCGIPDFRSRDGIYARLAEDFPDLPNPHAMFDIRYFRQNPKPFFKFAREIYPGQFKPSPCHRFIKLLEKHNKLLRNYTQNIDTLERVAEIERVVECHGSFSTASCTNCGYRVNSDEIKEAIFEQRIPLCTKCTPEEGVQNVMKPDIVFFGEDLPGTFHDAMAQDRKECDLLIVIGSSLNVRPVSLIPSFLPPDVPQILINREMLHCTLFDVNLLGDSDVIVDHLCRSLGGDWEKEVCWRDSPLIDCGDCPPDASGGSSPTKKTSGRLSNDEGTGDDQDSNLESTNAPVVCQKIGKRHIGEHSRHISLESSRDSGIGESSHDGIPPWATLDNSIYSTRQRQYIFPGAEINNFRFRSHKIDDVDIDLLFSPEEGKSSSTDETDDPASQTDDPPSQADDLPSPADDLPSPADDLPSQNDDPICQTGDLSPTDERNFKDSLEERKEKPLEDQPIENN